MNQVALACPEALAASNPGNRKKQSRLNHLAVKKNFAKKSVVDFCIARCAGGGSDRLPAWSLARKDAVQNFSYISAERMLFLERF